MEKDQDEKQSVDQVTVPERNEEETPNPEKPEDSSSAISEAGESEHEYISGIKLWVVLASVTFIAFLMMLDMAIIVTVRL